MKEVWKNIKNYEGYYQVSNYGNIKNVRTGRILKHFIQGCNYYYVILSINNKQKHKYIHRLVAEAFIPNPNNYKYINHKDENKLNNNIENLEWCTQKYNCNYGNGIEKGHINQRKKINQYDLQGNFIKQWDSALQIRKHLNISDTHVGDCCKGITKSFKNYIWKYVNDNN